MKPPETSLKVGLNFNFRGTCSEAVEKVAMCPDILTALGANSRGTAESDPCEGSRVNKNNDKNRDV